MRETPLEQPWYGISFSSAITRAFKKYATFKGRASGSEFWWFWLFNTLVNGALGFLVGLMGMDTRYNIYERATTSSLNEFGYFLTALMIGYTLAIIIPNISVGVRRLHDTRKSGVWYCVLLIPVIGEIWLILMMAGETYPGPTQWDIPRDLPPEEHARQE